MKSLFLISFGMKDSEVINIEKENKKNVGPEFLFNCLDGNANLKLFL